MSFTSAPYGGSFTQATDLEVNTESDDLYLTPGQLPFLPNIPYAGFSFFETNSDRYTIDFNGSSAIGGGGPPSVDFTFTTPLSSTDYVIKLSNDYMKYTPAPIINKSTTGFTFQYNAIGSCAVMVFLEGYI